jgi:hypothetical protein
MLNKTQSFFLILCIFIVIYIFSDFYTKNVENDTEFNNKISNYMGFIFLSFGFLKLYDIHKFVTIFNKYDIISQKINLYPYLYPFIEILVGLALINNYQMIHFIKLIIALMMISIGSVVVSLYRGQELRCGCLGSFFHIPLSYVTLSENIMMLVMGIMYLNI